MIISRLIAETVLQTRDILILPLKKSLIAMNQATQNHVCDYEQILHHWFAILLDLRQL